MFFQIDKMEVFATSQFLYWYNNQGFAFYELEILSNL